MALKIDPNWRIWADVGFDIMPPQEIANELQEDVEDENGVIYHPEKQGD